LKIRGVGDILLARSASWFLRPGRKTRWEVIVVTVSEVIVQRLKALPASVQQEVLDFVEFLESRRQERAVQEEDAAWSAFSLASAMRGMEEEETLYTLADIKEAFR
jgi:hypothetical protein